MYRWWAQTVWAQQGGISCNKTNKSSRSSTTGILLCTNGSLLLYLSYTRLLNLSQRTWERMLFFWNKTQVCLEACLSSVRTEFVTISLSANCLFIQFIKHSFYGGDGQSIRKLTGWSASYSSVPIYHSKTRLQFSGSTVYIIYDSLKTGMRVCFTSLFAPWKNGGQLDLIWYELGMIFPFMCILICTPKCIPYGLLWTPITQLYQQINSATYLHVFPDTDSSQSSFKSAQTTGKNDRPENIHSWVGSFSTAQTVTLGVCQDPHRCNRTKYFNNCPVA